jgi:hypothetical protein
VIVHVPRRTTVARLDIDEPVQPNETLSGSSES